MICVVHAICNNITRKLLWEEISTFRFSCPWMLSGDFNCVTCWEEKCGGNPINLNEVSDFNTMIANLGLEDGGYSGSKFTWCNNRLGRARILERLDRVLFDSQWIASLITEVSHLHRTCSDHFPLLLNFGPATSVGASFRFINASARHHQFLELVQNSWSCPATGRPLTKFAKKLKMLRQNLRAWNKEVYGNIHQNVKMLKMMC